MFSWEEPRICNLPFRERFVGRLDGSQPPQRRHRHLFSCVLLWTLGHQPLVAFATVCKWCTLPGSRDHNECIEPYLELAHIFVALSASVRSQSYISVCFVFFSFLSFIIIIFCSIRQITSFLFLVSQFSFRTCWIWCMLYTHIHTTYLGGGPTLYSACGYLGEYGVCAQFGIIFNLNLLFELFCGFFFHTSCWLHGVNIKVFGFCGDREWNRRAARNAIVNLLFRVLDSIIFYLCIY